MRDKIECLTHLYEELKSEVDKIKGSIDSLHPSWNYCKPSLRRLTLKMKTMELIVCDDLNKAKEKRMECSNEKYD